MTVEEDFRLWQPHQVQLRIHIRQYKLISLFWLHRGGFGYDLDNALKKCEFDLNSVLIKTQSENLFLLDGIL